MSHQKCNACGLCKSNCPGYNLTKNETKSPRAKMILIRENMLSKGFHNCLMCDACKQDCPSEIDIPNEIRKARIALINSMQESEESKKIIENLRNKGNIYGI